MTFSGEIFLSSKVPEFLHVVFNVTEKHSPVIFFGWFALCFFVNTKYLEVFSLNDFVEQLF